MSRGGRRIGAGRPSGSRNRRTIELGDCLDTLVPDEWLIKILLKMAKSGDARAAIYLADRKWGKPPVASQGTSLDEPSVRVVVNTSKFGVVT